MEGLKSRMGRSRKGSDLVVAVVDCMLWNMESTHRLIFLDIQQFNT